MGQKRSRESDVDELDFYDDGQARKKSRMGWPAQQWITIYNKHVPMKQRSAGYCRYLEASRKGCQKCLETVA